jgi:hypothetical protein
MNRLCPLNDTSRLLYATESWANLHIPCAETGSRDTQDKRLSEPYVEQAATVICMCSPSRAPSKGVSDTTLPCVAHNGIKHAPAGNTEELWLGHSEPKVGQVATVIHCT